MALEDGTYREKRIQTMHNKGMVEGFPNCNLEVDFCEQCIYGKQNHVRFPSGATRVIWIMELIHSDVYGHVHVPTLGGSMYYVYFIDDFSKKTWLYFLRKKYEVFSKFKEFKSLVENQIEKKVKVLRIDNKSEFHGKEFEKLCKQCGIACQNTTPYTPQHNGVAQRMKEMLMEKVLKFCNFG
jgi:transposase InsO family protein